MKKKNTIKGPTLTWIFMYPIKFYVASLNFNGFSQKRRKYTARIALGNNAPSRQVSSAVKLLDLEAQGPDFESRW